MKERLLMATTEPKNNQAVATANPAPPSGAGICCYIGPNIHGIIQTSTIYRGDKKTVLKSPAVALALKQYPGIAELIVPGEHLAEDRIKARTPGEALFKAYKALAHKAK